MAADPLSAISTRATPQSQRADARQVPNSAGGFTWAVSDMTLLHRFLTIGTAGGTFYVGEKELTKEIVADEILRMCREDGETVVREAVRISQGGRAPRNNGAVFALAAVAGLGTTEARQAAFAALPLVARTGMHLYLFTKYAENFRGWGRGMRRAVGSWFLDKSPQDISYQVLKYRQREGWTQRDLLRLAHPFVKDLRVLPEDRPVHVELFKWLCRRSPDLGELPLVDAFKRAQAATTAKAWAEIIRSSETFAHEWLPSQALRERAVWEALLESERKLPLDALLRNLNRLTRLGLLGPGDPFTTGLVAGRLTDAERLRKARMHPIKILVALRTYASGHSVSADGRRTTTWDPYAPVIDCLDDSFYRSFGIIEPAGARTVVGLDVSGSMGHPAGGLSITCREVTAAMSMATVRTEPHAVVMGFAHDFRNLGISPRQRLDDVIERVYHSDFGRTDCALPMLWAMQNRVQADHFSVYTDNETWFGKIHPHQALRQYRERSGINARLSVVGITATRFSIADPADPLQIDVAGFDAEVPQMLASFARGEF